MERKRVCTQQLYHCCIPWYLFLGKRIPLLCSPEYFTVLEISHLVFCFSWLWVGLRQGTWGPQTAALTLCDVLCFCTCYWLISYLTSPTGMSASWEQGFLHVWFIFFISLEMATHCSVLAWRIPGTGEPGGLPSMGLHRVGHDWSDLAAVAVLITGEGKRPIYPLFPHTHIHTQRYTYRTVPLFVCLVHFFYIPSANNWRRKETHLPTLSTHTDTHTHNCSPQRTWKSSPKGKYRCWWRE